LIPERACQCCRKKSKRLALYRERRENERNTWGGRVKERIGKRSPGAYFPETKERRDRDFTSLPEEREIFSGPDTDWRGTAELNRESGVFYLTNARDGREFGHCGGNRRKTSLKGT